MAHETKYCPRCQEERPISEFYRNTGRYDGLSPLCVVHARQAANESNRAKRLAFLEAMGGCCERCGFKDVRALQVDHVLGDGRIERTAEGRGGTAKWYTKVLANRERYTLLCANCNIIKKVEQDETVGDRVYTRHPPTEKVIGVGKGNASVQRAALEASRTSVAQAARGAKNKGQRRPNIAAARKGTKLIDGHWVHPE